MNRWGILIACCVLAGCLELRASAPQPEYQGDYLVHVVASKDETLSKILTWYTGTNLSREIVMSANPYLGKRDLKVGDKVLLPSELVANSLPYGQESQKKKRSAPNLLMGEEKRTALPQAELETFHDDTNPDTAERAESKSSSEDVSAQRIKRLREEIEAKERELQELQQKSSATGSGRESETSTTVPPGMEPF